LFVLQSASVDRRIIRFSKSIKSNFVIDTVTVDRHFRSSFKMTRLGRSLPGFLLASLCLLHFAPIQPVSASKMAMMRKIRKLKDVLPLLMLLKHKKKIKILPLPIPLPLPLP
jgi:hypothetical protein